MTDTINKTKLEVTFELTIADDDIDCIVCSAFEGGINYWCHKAVVLNDDYKGKEFASEVISAGGTVALYDSHECESGKHYDLTKDKLLTGLKRAITEHHVSCLESDPRTGEPTIDAGMIDAGDADIIVQLAVMGEVVYA